MPIVFRCENCDRRYRVADENAGRPARCKDCGHEMRVPTPSPPVERSESGSPIYRHQPRERDFEPAIGDGESIDALTEHVERHLGEIDVVFHEMVSDLVHVDVHRIPPTADRPYYTLVTTGMSDRPMTVPEGAEDYRHAELLIHLAPDWPLEQADFSDETNYWPIRLLKMLARLPHEYDTWLGPGHTVPNGDPPEPYAPNCRFTCALLMPPMVTDEDFSPVAIGPDKSVHFYWVIPLYPEETDFKLRKGVEPLLDRFERCAIPPVLDLRRKNVCRKRFGLF